MPNKSRSFEKYLLLFPSAYESNVYCVTSPLVQKLSFEAIIRDEHCPYLWTLLSKVCYDFTLQSLLISDNKVERLISGYNADLNIVLKR